MQTTLYNLFSFRSFVYNIKLSHAIYFLFFFYILSIWKHHEWWDHLVLKLRQSIFKILKNLIRYRHVLRQTISKFLKHLIRYVYVFTLNHEFDAIRLVAGIIISALEIFVIHDIYRVTWIILIRNIYMIRSKMLSKLRKSLGGFL